MTENRGAQAVHNLYTGCTLGMHARSVLGWTYRCFTVVVFFLGVSPAIADTQRAFEALVLERCLPSVSTGRPLPTQGMKKLSRKVGARFVGDAPGRFFADQESFVLLHRISRNACSVLNFQADARAIASFSDKWFGVGTPFNRTQSEGSVNLVLKRAYEGSINGHKIFVLISTSAQREFGVITISREN